MGRETKYAVDKLDEGDLRRMWLFLVQEGFNFVDSYGFRAKLVRTRRAGFSAELDSVFHKIVSVSIVLKFGLMAENKLLFLEFPLPRGLGTISIFGIQSGLRGKLHTKGEILGGEKATKRGGIPEISNNTEIPK